MRSTVTVLAVLTLAAACGNDDGPSRARAGDSGGVRYTTTDTVLESPDHDPQLCLGVVAESYPPQCGGPDVVGWDWDAVEGEESASGTTWGTYTVVGTWDGQALTLTEPPVAARQAGSSREEPDPFATPCPEPDGGWRVVDGSTATEEAMEAAISYARSQPSVGGVWVDQSINPALDDPASVEDPAFLERVANDPTATILNLSFTEGVERHEQAVRALWGGALCVSEASISAAELEAIRTEVEAEVGDFLTSGIDEVEGRVEIGVAVDDGLQERLDDRYGPGVVKIQARLQPVGG